MALILVLAGSGCFVERWAKPGATPADFDRDRTACEQEGAVAGPVVDEAAFAECMERRGYRQR